RWSSSQGLRRIDAAERSITSRSANVGGPSGACCLLRCTLRLQHQTCYSQSVILGLGVNPMRRREFIALLGSGVAAWPLAARAQQDQRLRRIGWLVGGLAENDPESRGRVEAFVNALRELGWTEGHNMRIEYRWGAANVENNRKQAAELIALTPDVVLANASGSVHALQEASRTVPIVFVQVPDPVGAGFVDSLARPGGNATGFTTFEYGIGAKWLELLKEIAPGVKRAAVLRDPTNPAGIGQWGAIQSVAPSFGVELSAVNMRSET